MMGPGLTSRRPVYAARDCKTSRRARSSLRQNSISVPGPGTARGSCWISRQSIPMPPPENSSTSSIRLLLVDDHEIVRMGLRELFNRSQGIEVVGEAGSVAGAVAEATRLKPDVILMDVRLPDGSGVEACREILAACPGTRVLFLTSYQDDEAMLSAVFA